MKKIIYCITLAASVVGTDALFCPDQLTKTQIKEIAAKGTVKLGGLDFTAVSQNDRNAATGAAVRMGVFSKLTMVKGEREGDDDISLPSKTVTCAYRFQSASEKPEEAHKFKISRKLTDSELKNLAESKLGGTKGFAAKARLLKEKRERENIG